MQINVATITTGEASLQNQTLGLAKSLSDAVEQYVVQPHKFFGKLPAFMVPAWSLALPEIKSASVLISCGRKSAAYSLALKKQNPDLITIHIHDPQIPTKYFDLVVPMQHDNCRGKNIYPVKTAIHHLQQADLLNATTGFESRLAQMPEKKVAFLLGGNTKDYTFSEANFNTLIEGIASLRQKGIGILLSTARRTPDKYKEYLKRFSEPDMWVYTGEGENPYLCFLQEADSFVITAESVSMVSEALFTGKPVQVFPLEGFNKRLDRFKNHLLEQDLIRVWQGELESYHYPKQDSKLAAAEYIRQHVLKNRE